LARPRLRVERDDRPGAARERLLGDALGLWIERRVDVIADRVGAQLTEDRAQPGLQSAQRELARLRQARHLPLERVEVPDGLREQGAGWIRAFPGVSRGWNRLREHLAVVGDNLSALDPQVVDERAAVERIGRQRGGAEHRPARGPA